MQECVIVDAGCARGYHMIGVRSELQKSGIEPYVIGIDDCFRLPGTIDLCVMRLLLPTLRHFGLCKDSNLDRPTWLRTIPPFRRWHRKGFVLPALDGSNIYDDFIHCDIRDCKMTGVADFVVLSYVASPHTDNFGAVYANVSRMLKPDGRLICNNLRWEDAPDVVHILSKREVERVGLLG